MAESATVVPIKPVRKTRPPSFTSKSVVRRLHTHQARVYEAVAVAKLLSLHAREPAQSRSQ